VETWIESVARGRESFLGEKQYPSGERPAHAWDLGFGEPEPFPGASIAVNDQECGRGGSLDFGSGDLQDRWVRWIEQTVLFRNSADRSNFSGIRLL
jgi:hypothetical protein